VCEQFGKLGEPGHKARQQFRRGRRSRGAVLREARVENTELLVELADAVRRTATPSGLAPSGQRGGVALERGDLERQRARIGGVRTSTSITPASRVSEK